MKCEKCGQEIQWFNNRPLPCCHCSDRPVFAVMVRRPMANVAWTRMEYAAADAAFEEVLLLRRAWRQHDLPWQHYWAPADYEGDPPFDIRA